MQIGTFLIAVAFLSMIVSLWYYSIGSKKSQPRRSKRKRAEKDNPVVWLKPARWGFHFMTFFVGLAGVRLVYLLLTHQFQFSYVYRYSSTDLPFGYLISAFWAGQEGSFLLWVILIAILGQVFIRSENQLESHAMVVVNLVQAFFLLVLLKANPFEIQATRPLEGAGLNPLLQNPWMVIHPPVLFVGYAATTFPVAIAIAALLKKQFDRWARIAFPWVLFASLTLGAGIIIGGYWAYGVLGWGGYWGWDPVENSSLIVWLVVLALFHALIITRRTGALQKTSFTLSALSLGLVLYATFLTRSGVLADFSVHSFQDLGINAYLIIGIVGILLAGFWMIFRAKHEIPDVQIDWSGMNRENALVIAIIVLLASGSFILIGTSSPILTSLWGSPGQVDVSFYNKVNFPVAILISLLLGAAPFLIWNNLSLGAMASRWLLSSVLAVFSTLVAVLLGVDSPMHIIFIAMAAWALWSNVINAYISFKKNWIFSGAPLSHIGVALLFISVIISGTKDRSEQVTLIKDVPKLALGHELVYRGVTRAMNGKDIMEIDISHGNDSYRAVPRLYQNSYGEGMMHEPFIRSGFLKDTYLSPLARSENKVSASERSISLTKGEKKSIVDFDIVFTSFEMANHAENGEFRVGAKLELSKNNRKFIVTPAVVMGSEKNTAHAVKLPQELNGNGAKVRLAGMDADAKQIELVFEGLDGKIASNQVRDELVVELSEKPFMSILWLGSVLILVGTVISIIRRRRDAMLQ